VLLSGVLPLQCTRGGMLASTHGHAVHGWFLDLVARHDVALAAVLHNGPGPRPFTLSMVRGGARRAKGTLRLEEGQEAWLRITSLDGRLTEFLVGLDLECTGPIPLLGCEFVPGRLRTDARDHRWARLETFEALLARSGERQAGRIAILFASPTTFRSGPESIPLPLPRLVLRSLAAKWSAFGPAPLDPRLLDEASRALRLARYSLSTALLEFPDYRLVGFEGRCEFLLDGADGEAAQIARGLLALAFFAGVGYKTMMGMGQVWPSLALRKAGRR